ncbi:hypothetical protein [Actinomadura sp. HBU206391]|uniref:hypothetical protein n=1 Tax=Actinomadura sp. HBU206391 TaxID=2731692 RepID=UPI00164F30C5|nr:hypothetical protein [Actinomadura sp. HBU206391]MBC6458409.1 hypothetical protein [Actinomadura sp. HBU206391]
MNLRVDALVQGMRLIHAEPAPRLQKARWYVLEPLGWARCTWLERRRYPIARAYVRLQQALGIRACRSTDSKLRVALLEPWEFTGSYWGRFKCRTLHRHNTHCIGASDHFPDHMPGPTGCGHW